MEKNRRDPITGEWDDPLSDWADEVPADPPADRSDSGAAASANDFRGDGATDTPQNSSADSDEERIGYGRPPRKHQFKRGQSSPNPSGRPKGVKNEATILKELLEEKIQIRVGSRVRTVTMRTAMLMRFRDAALKGDIKSATFILNRQNQHASNEPAQPDINQDDQAVIEEYLRKALRARKGEDE